MSNKQRGLLVSLLLLAAAFLAACGPAAGEPPALDTVPASPTTIALVTITPTVLPAGTATPLVTATAPSPAPTLPPTPLVSTAVPGVVSPPATSLPGEATAPRPTAVPLTPIPTLAAGLSPTRLKYLVLVAYPDFFYCDPDYYPIQQADETALAVQRFPQIQENVEEFSAILEHLGLSGQTEFTREQQLLIYQEHKRLAAVPFTAAGNGYTFQIQTSAGGRSGLLITGTISAAGLISEQGRQASIATCPICLAAGTLIDTPLGRVPVEQLRPGDPVWTVAKNGRRAAGTIQETGRALVPATHLMVRLLLADGRELFASPGHPTGDGRALADLRPGDALDGSLILVAGRLRYSRPATHDILPSGPTGLYWANGVLLGSTLR